MPAKRLVAIALIGTSVVACSVNSGPKEVGTPAGAIAGRTTFDDDDKRRAAAAQTHALETGPSGVPVAWRNPESGHYGNVVPGPAYQANGKTCRQYTTTIYLDGAPQTARAAACRNADGTWTAAN
jgi:surface antigen